MARTAKKLDLRTFQQELASRLATKTAAQVESSRLGLSCGGERWLIRLADAGEVVTMPAIVPVPLTRPWYLGVANIRGNLYSVVDFARFLGRESPPGMAGNARLVLFGPRAGEMNAGLVVTRVLGLRNVAELAPAAPPQDVPAWYAQRWMDGDGNAWQEIDLAVLAKDTAFLQVGL
jgi:twitching motility protein PilI